MKQERTKKIMCNARLIDIGKDISKGKSRQTILQQLQDEGVAYGQAVSLYYQALKELTPDSNILDEYKRGVIQANLDRLEHIIETTITGNTGDKKVALNAIAELNKMVGASEANKVMIGKNNQGEEIIEITFQK